MELSYFELFAAAVSLVGVWLTVKRNKLCWLFDIIGTLMYFLIFYNAKLYSDSALQIIFIVFQIYGWILWTVKLDKTEENQNDFIIKYLKFKDYLILSVIFVISSLFIGNVLKKETDAALPFADTSLTVLSIIGSYLQAKKYIENWHLWIIANAGYIAMLVYKHLYITSFLYFVFLILAVIGLIEWKKFETNK